MLHYTEYRNLNNGQAEILLNDRELPIEEVVELLFKYELGYGGELSWVSAEKIEVKTRVMSKTDRTVISGFAGEMEPLHDLVQLYLLSNERRDASILKDLCEISLQRLRGNPFLITNIVPLLLGRARNQGFAEWLKSQVRVY